MTRFFFRAFTMKPKGIGEIEAELQYEQEVFRLHFNFEFKSNKQEALARNLFADLLGGEEFIDQEE